MQVTILINYYFINSMLPQALEFSNQADLGKIITEDTQYGRCLGVKADEVQYLIRINV